MIAFATPGPDPFRRPSGSSSGGATTGRPPWRAVYGLAHGRRDGVLAISADTTDLTGDGVDDALIREETGGSGACATYRVIDLAAAADLDACRSATPRSSRTPTRSACIEVARIYAPEDPHCCPSAIRERRARVRTATASWWSRKTSATL